jgi:serine/threonine-protein kinase
MQPPIATGTVLQNRYRLLSVLGQGGFGRTYLAEDLGRFNERCALKEFIPSQPGAYALEKSKELFQREASILYQIQHPQIPQFRATFEENERLFLVQDYVEGKTYRDLLNERKVQGQTFSEAEVFQLMQQLLPVLAHIHSKGIIHRDIAPDNIILRQQDRLPVLIDFGVVKEIVTRLQMPGAALQNTTVGKPGYAPSEQMQTGRAYPSSDLYSLAATVVVLLTGREPQDLFDDINLTWHWQRYATVSPDFAKILNQMLNYRPGDRYQSVSEVAQALQTLTSPAAIPPSPTAAVAPPPAPNVSRMQTLAVGRRPEAPAPSPRSGTRPEPVIPASTEPSVWDNPLAVIGICLGLAVVTGIGSWAVVSAILNTSPSIPVASPTPSPTPTPTRTVSPTPTPTPTPTEPVQYEQRLNLQPGETTTTQGNLKTNETVTYIISAHQGDILSATLEEEGTLVTVLGPNREPLEDNSVRVPGWEGPVDFTGKQYIQVSPVRNVSESDYRLSIGLQAAAEPTPTLTPTPTPTPTPPPPVEPEIVTQQVQFPAGAESISVAEEAGSTVVRRYVVNAQAGQIMTAELLSGAVSFDVRYPNGNLVEDASSVTFWQFSLPESGDYIIDVTADSPSPFELRISVTGSPQQG